MWPFIELSEVHCGGVWGYIFITELYSNWWTVEWHSLFRLSAVIPLSVCWDNSFHFAELCSRESDKLTKQQGSVL